VYDAENKMTRARGGNNQWQEYTYNADGQRTRRKINGAETWQIYGMDGELLAEYAAGASVNLTYRVEGQMVVTNQPSAPREERTRFRLTPQGKLILEFGGVESQYVRAS